MNDAPNVTPVRPLLSRIWHRFLNRTAHLRLDILFPFQLSVAVGVLNRFGNLRYCQKLQNQLATLPENTVGKTLSRLLEKQNLHLVPWYMEHDLKHALLGYKMEAPDEMRMQCFMWGNAGFSPFNTLMTLTFLVWTPEMWADIKHHYAAGKRIKNLRNYRLESCMHRDLASLRAEIELEKAKEYLKCVKK